MDVANMLSHDPPNSHRSQHSAEQSQESQRSHQYPTRHSVMANAYQADAQHVLHNGVPPAIDKFADASPPTYGVPQSAHPRKNVAFELLFDDRSAYRARLPMRVQIFPHDTTDSIVTTVKNFYGLYEGAAKGVSFEDEEGNTLIARYENFKNDMIVYVRVIADYAEPWQPHERPLRLLPTPTSAQRTPHLEAGFEMPPPQLAQGLNYGQATSRPSSRLARRKSVSPGIGSNRRSGSVQKSRSRPGVKSREDTFQPAFEENNNDVLREYSSSDGEGGSVTSSRKARNEQLASAEISLENIVEGGRRQRAKFESSELPLFVPPQVPATNSISSISPQRRSNGQENPSPFARPVQRSLSYTQPLQSPQSYGFFDSPNEILSLSKPGSKIQSSMQYGHRLRDRVTAPGPLTRLSGGIQPRGSGAGILPTPDPTIASCISDEDVALQLMRLGDASNFSGHGRTSASTQDDTLSGRADIASSASSESDDEMSDDQAPTHEGEHSFLNTSSLKAKARAKQRQQNAAAMKQDGGELAIGGDDSYSEEDEEDHFLDETGPPTKKIKIPGSKVGSSNGIKAHNPMAPKKIPKAPKMQQTASAKKSKQSIPPNPSKTAMSPPSIIPQSRKTSSASATSHPNPGGLDDDLSTKPRCQRCRKSKKGCDRQRPCQRCKDAGIGIEGCVSEEEGNGRKGRFGRHMGVSVVKTELPSPVSNIDIGEADATHEDYNGTLDKSKKRKRV